MKPGGNKRGKVKKVNGLNGDVTLLEHSEGMSVSCPELPGCHSQGATVDEAIENIRNAIHGCLELYGAPELDCRRMF